MERYDNTLPVKGPFSLQLDLHSFDKVTEEEKALPPRIGASTT